MKSKAELLKEANDKFKIEYKNFSSNPHKDYASWFQVKEDGSLKILPLNQDRTIILDITQAEELALWLKENYLDRT